jgi:DNA repair protein RadA/Sms
MINNPAEISNQLEENVLALSLEEQRRKATRIKPLKEWFVLADTQPDIEPLFYHFIGSGEIVIVFGDTGIGKTLFGYYMAMNFARQNKDVIYYCLEMQEKQVRKRYPNLIPPDNFFRADFNPDYEGERFDFEVIFSAICRDLESIEGDCILFLDNLKALSLASLKDNEIAIQVMNALKKLSNKYKEQNRRLTIVVFAHVNKIMAWQPMELNHLSGAKELQIFLDSAIGFAECSQNPKIKYLKHLKSRNAEKHTEVLLLESTTENGNHIFRELGWDEEANHLAAKPESGTVLTDAMYQAYNLAQEGSSYSQIAKQLYISDKTVKSYIEKVKKMQGGSESSETTEARQKTTSSEPKYEVTRYPHSET